ncbi:MAG: hypothetical protein R3A47_03120 [Polyangiales bacterium]
MDLQRMLEKCESLQWDIDDLDWSMPSKALPKEKEIAVCQYFTDMAGIELLASKLFEVQRDQTDDPTLKAIFDSFVVDELRHCEAALRLAKDYDRHHYRRYERNKALVRFSHWFHQVVTLVSPEIANAYITTGELFLDIALLRSLNDYVNDEMSNAAMELINRDESRHIAMDYYMVEYYSSPEFAEKDIGLFDRSPKEHAQRAYAFAQMMLSARPFLRDVFFTPLQLTDPTARRLKEVFKRVQLIGRKPEVQARPFPRFAKAMQDLFQHPKYGRYFGPIVVRVIGVDPSVLHNLYSDEEYAWAMKASLEEMANEALTAKSLQ